MVKNDDDNDDGIPADVVVYLEIELLILVRSYFIICWNNGFYRIF